MKIAWATLVMLDESYACGALVLGASLRRANTSADLICMVTDDIPEDVADSLKEFWDYVVEVPVVKALRGVRQREQRRFGHMYSPWLSFCLTKFTILNMRQYDKIAFLDADMLCIACAPSPGTRPGVASTAPLPRGSTSAASGQGQDPLPRLAPRPGGTSGAGCLLLLKPDPGLFADIVRMSETEPIGQSEAMAGPDEHLITKLLLDRGYTWHHIDSRFGMTSWAAFKENPEALGLGDLPPLFLHYVSEKPWAAPASGRAPGATQNWEDFALWDEVAQRLVLPALAPGLEKRLFHGWCRRTLLPRVSSNEG